MAELMITKAVLQAAIASGKGITQTGDFLGVSRGALQRAEKRYGIYFERLPPGAHKDLGPTDYRSAVQDMKPMDAVEYLLDELEALLKPPVDAWAFPAIAMTPNERRILRFLADRAPRWVTREALLRVISGSRHEDEWPDIKIVDVQLSRIRSKTKVLGLTFPHGPWGTGSWTVEAPAGFVWPWQ